MANGLSDVGGGIYNQANLALDAVTVASNKASNGQGGGIYNAGDLTVTNSDITGNSASGESVYGGGIYTVGSLVIDHSTLSGNIAAALGGGTKPYSYGGAITNFGTLTVDTSVISTNKTTANNTIFDGAYSYGGAIANFGTSTVDTSLVSKNMSDAGSMGTSYVYGGGIYSSGPMTLFRSTVTANTAYASFKVFDVVQGGGIYNSGTLTVDSSTISANVAGGDPNAASGGGIYNKMPSGTASILNSTIAGNQAHASTCNPCKAYGGGIFGAGVSVRGSTIAGNSSTGTSQFGGGVFNDGAGAALSNTVVAGNLASTGPDVSGTLASSAYDLFGKSAGGSGYGSSDLLDVDPLLGPLQDNGGPTQTMALLPGSPAIDSGDNTNAPDWDQRGPGYPRIVNSTIDIGAFEVQNTGAPTGDPRPLGTVALSGAPTGRTTLAQANGLGISPTPTDQALKGRNSQAPAVTVIGSPLQGSKLALARVPRAVPGADMWSPFGAPDDLANFLR
jgi:hypothetical protein